MADEQTSCIHCNVQASRTTPCEACEQAGHTHDLFECSACFMTFAPAIVTGCRSTDADLTLHALK